MEILIMLLVAFLLGLWLGYMLWHKYRQMYLDLQAENNRMHAKLTDLEKDFASLKYQHDELEKDNKAHRNKIRSLDADVAIWKGKYERLLAEMENGGGGHTANTLVGGAVTPDDLKKIEGIGPKIAELLNNAGIHSWAQLAKCPVEDLKKILQDAGPRYQMHDPTTWPKQAALAAAGKWDELKELQDYLDGGKPPA